MSALAAKAWHSGASTLARRAPLRGGTAALTTMYSLYKVHPTTWRWTATNYQPWMGDFARLHAWMTSPARERGYQIAERVHHLVPPVSIGQVVPCGDHQQVAISH